MDAFAASGDSDSQAVMRSIIQRIATGPELSRAISEQEAIFFIALRMKRETAEQNRGVLDATRDYTLAVTADVDELVDLAAPCDEPLRTDPVRIEAGSIRVNPR